MKSSSARNCFVGLNDRQVLSQVGRFGEEMAATLVNGQIVSDHPEDFPFADVVNTGIGLAVQVKMCNGRHAQRPLPKQITDLFDQIDDTHFLFDKGVYTFIFYRGINEKKNHRGQSKIWSRKFSRATRRDIICHELQYIYILDVRLLRHMVDCPKFIRVGTIVYVPEEKPTRDKVLYLNRTFMAGFPQNGESHRALLDTALGKGCWSVKTITQELHFIDGINGPFRRQIPIHVVGSRRTVRALLPVLNKPIAPIHLGQNDAPKML